MGKRKDGDPIEEIRKRLRPVAHVRCPHCSHAVAIQPHLFHRLLHENREQSLRMLKSVTRPIGVESVRKDREGRTVARIVPLDPE